MRVAAGQRHRAGVTGRHVAVRVIGRDVTTLPAAPAVSLVGKPVIVSVFAAAACTVIPDSVPVMLDVTVSVAVIDCVPAVSSVTAKVCVPVGAGKVKLDGRTALRVAAGQGHRAGVAGRHVAIGVVGRDRRRYRPRPPCRWWGTR